MTGGVGAGDGPSWSCPACGGTARPEGEVESRGLRCEGCGARYRHPRMAMLLALALPGWGSIHQKRRFTGIVILAFGSAAFAWTVWRMWFHVRHALLQEDAGLAGVRALMHDVALGIGLVIASYLIDLLLVWVRRNRLIPRE